MAIKGIASKDYLTYLRRNKRCVISGRKNPDVHHESVSSKYRGYLKRYFDFGAIPLAHELHVGKRHEWGKVAFWGYYGMDPAHVARKLVQSYIEDGGADAELAREALKLIDDSRL